MYWILLFEWNPTQMNASGERIYSLVSYVVMYKGKALCQ